MKGGGGAGEGEKGVGREREREREGGEERVKDMRGERGR